MIGVELRHGAPEVWKTLLDNGIICNLSHNKTLRLLPPLIIDDADIARFVAGLDMALAGLASN